MSHQRRKIPILPLNESRNGVRTRVVAIHIPRVGAPSMLPRTRCLLVRYYSYSFPKGRTTSQRYWCTNRPPWEVFLFGRQSYAGSTCPAPIEPSWFVPSPPPATGRSLSCVRNSFPGGHSVKHWCGGLLVEERRCATLRRYTYSTRIATLCRQTSIR